MIKVAVEIPDYTFSGVDLSQPQYGNPGVGGSEYLFTLLAYLLKKNGVDIVVYHYNENILPNDLSDVVVKDCISMLYKAEMDGVNVLIHQVGKSENWYAALEKTQINSIAWAHVYLDYYELKILRKNNNVRRVVFVGKEEYDSYIDDDIIKKSTFIYNMIPTKVSACKRSLDKSIVTYVGSLVPAKGFHKLAKIWPEVTKRIPDAELYVIGNGKVYDRSAKLGKYGISQQDYEDSFMRYLTDSKGNVLPSVHFMGIVGKEKNNIFKKTKVGVVNPTALTETFCMSAIEMEYAYIPVVTKKKWGLLDTVISGKTGFLFENEKQFITYIVSLLRDNCLNISMGESSHIFVKDNFSVDVILPKWLELLNNLDDEVSFLEVENNWSNDWKWLKQVIRLIRFNLHLKSFPSFYDMKYNIKLLLKKN